MIVALMAAPSKCTARQCTNTFDTRHRPACVTDRVWHSALYGDLRSIWWSHLRRRAFELEEFELEIAGHTRFDSLSAYLQSSFPHRGAVAAFLNHHFDEWILDVISPSEDDAREYLEDEMCDGCDGSDTCDEDRCDSYWNAYDEYMNENRDRNEQYLVDRWEEWNFESGTAIGLLTPETIGAFNPVPYLDNSFAFDRPCVVEEPVTLQHLRTVANAANRCPTMHLMNLWCRMRLAVSPDLDKEIDELPYKPRLWGPRAAATAVLAQDRHQSYMQESNVGWEVNYGHPVAT